MSAVYKATAITIHVFFLLHSQLVSCSTDKLLCLWDTETGTRIKKMRGHTAFVNSVYPARRGPSLIVSGGDDGTIKVIRNYVMLEAL